MKEIDVESGVRIYSKTKDDILDVMSLIGEKVYVSSTKDFECYGIFKLAGVKFVLNKDECFIVDTLGCTQLSYKYLILAKDVKFKEEKELRPFKDAEEFFEETGLELGKTIRYRKNNNIDKECVVIINGYTTDGHILIGGIYYKLKDLVGNYEYYDSDNSEWKPFGVEE